MNRWRVSGVAGVVGILLFWSVGCTTNGTNEKPPSDGGTTKDSTTGTDNTPKLQWYYTCGDPVCRGYVKPTNLSLCATQKEGQPCSKQGDECDPKDNCNRRLRCTDKDPRQQTGGCPISRKRFKKAIRYVSPDQLKNLHKLMQGLRLATWKYKQGDGRTQLGFVLEDLPSTHPAVNAKHDRVNLYGYTSLLVGALQVQAQQIKTLQKEMLKLKKSCGERKERTGK